MGELWALEGGLCEGKGRAKYIGGLQRTLEDCDCVILGCDIVEALWTAGEVSWDERSVGETNYFSTQGWSLAFSLSCTGALDEEPLVFAAAAAAARALLLKKFDMAGRCRWE